MSAAMDPRAFNESDWGAIAHDVDRLHEAVMTLLWFARGELVAATGDTQVESASRAVSVAEAAEDRARVLAMLCRKAQASLADGAGED